MSRSPPPFCNVRPQAATAGEKEFPVTVTFDLEPFDPSAEGYSRNKAFIIVSTD